MNIDDFTPEEKQIWIEFGVKMCGPEPERTEAFGMYIDPRILKFAIDNNLVFFDVESSKCINEYHLLAHIIKKIKEKSIAR